MPADASRITLVLPGFRTVFAQREMRLPSLELMVSRGSGLMSNGEAASRASLEPWQRGVLRALNIDADLPSAPLSWLGTEAAVESGTWLHVEPVHLAISIDGLALQPIPTWSESELTQLEPMLREHCEQAGFGWRRCGERVFLRSAAVLDLATVAPHAAVSGLRGAQPQGRDARRLIQLSTELQMVLHEHPSQRRRIAANQLPINALWFWGAGEPPTPAERALPQGWSSDRYVRGIYGMHGSACRVEPDVLSMVVEQATQDDLVVATATTADNAERRWFAPLQQALRHGVWRMARVFLDDVRFDIERAQLRRFWRRPHELTALRA